VSPDVTTLPPALVTWLVTAEHEPIADWAPEPPTGELRCDPDLVARLTQLARPIGNTRRRFVEGCLRQPGMTQEVAEELFRQVAAFAFTKRTARSTSRSAAR